jgi:hypothetical protein
MADFDSSLPIRTQNAGDAIVKVADATVPSQQLKVESDGSINVNGTLTLSPGAEVKITDGTDDLAINADGSLNAVVSATNLDIRDLAFATDKVDVSGSSISATDLDIRDLSSAQDSVEVLQASHDDLNANANLQVGNADVANGNPVPVSDAGGSLTVDASDLDIRDLAFATDKVDVSGSSVSVSATDLDIRDLTHASDSVKVGDGTEFLAINSDGSINVKLSDRSGLEIDSYNTASALAGGASDNHDYTATGAFRLTSVEASGSGKMKIEVQIETAAASNVFNTKFVQFNSTASPNMSIQLKSPILVSSGARVRVIRTNRDNQAQDVYSTILGYNE